MTMIYFLGWTVGPSQCDHDIVFLCGLWFLPQRDSEFHFMGGLCFSSTTVQSIPVCLWSMWLHPYPAWLCVLFQHDCTRYDYACWIRSLGQYASTLTLLGSLSRYVNYLPSWLVPSVTRSNLKNMSIWLIQILVMIIYCWYLLYIILSCCYCT